MPNRTQSLVSSSRTHLASVGESYVEHFRFAVAVGALMVAAGLACILHAFVPGVCRNTASRTLAGLNRALEDRSALDAALAETGEALAFALLLSMSLAVGAIFWLLGAHALVAVPLTLLALAFPAAVLAANPDLEPAEPRAGAGLEARPFPPSG
jgi:hypothetical protein